MDNKDKIYDTSEVQAKLDALKTATNDEIVKALYSGFMVVQVLATFYTVKNNIRTDEARIALEKLAKDDRRFWKPYKVSDHAIAALDVLGFKPYIGDSEEIKRFIDCKMDIGL